MADKIPSSGAAVPADVAAAMNAGVRQRYAISEVSVPKSKTGGVKK